ncbi:hypothetical protein SADUNF_Sadunf02G0109400 [Salix dunnii]|uniref:Secreted protein n=1 Tax=Salix dunnii TaxID=1413687 RepID=A0A835N786_9ROSI|nr:hypothetical protein SADUNF_Sadunf02G0109400 [Salix dunnii]
MAAIFALLAVAQICRAVRPSIPSSYVLVLFYAEHWIGLTLHRKVLGKFLATLSVSVRSLFVPVVSICLQIYCDTLCSSDPPPYPCRPDKARVGRPAKISDTHLLHFLRFSRSASSVLFIAAGNERKGVTLTTVKHPHINDTQLLRLGLKLWLISI